MTLNVLLRILTVIILLLALAGPSPAAGTELVTFPTSDRLKIGGELRKAGRAGAPAVVAIHGIEGETGRWAKIGRALSAGGIDFLTIHLRGFGDSRRQKGKDLFEKVKARDARLFRSMWKDVLGARDFLVRRGGDPERVAFLGVGLGAAVAVDAARREPRVLGVAALSPGTDFPGIDTIRRLESWGDRPLLLLAKTGEEKEARAMAKAAGRAAKLAVLASDAKIEKRLLSRLPDLLGAGFYLDGEVTKSEEPRVLFGDWDMMENGKGRPALHARGRWLHAAIRLTGGTGAPEIFYFAWARDGEAERARRIACEFGRKGAKFTYEALEGGKWKPVKGALPKDARLGVSGEKAVEILLPRRLEGLSGEGALSVAFGLARKRGNLLSALPLRDDDLTDVKRWLDFYLPE